MLVIRTKSPDLWRNLAAEELLIERVGEHRRILFLWQAENAVVVGKNQNPWRECRVRTVMEEGGEVARRVSGGGAVYVDLGNLNFAFFARRIEHDPVWSFEIVLRALRRCGVAGKLTGRNTISAGGRKFSGSAYCIRRGGALHHGTLLVSADLDRLRRYLVPSEHVLNTRAVASQPAPVVNLSDLAPGLGVEALASALEECFREACGSGERVGDDFLERLDLRPVAYRYRSWAWRFGRTPPFDADLTGEFDGSEFHVRLYIAGGVIEQAVVVVQGGLEKTADAIEEALVDTPFEEPEIFAKLLALAPVTIEESLAYRLARWLGSV